VMGAPILPQQAPEALWPYADPSHVKFNEEVPGELIGVHDRSTIVGSVGLVPDGGPTDPRTFVERVMPKDRPEWLDEKHSGAGRDARLNSISREEDGSRRVLLRDARITTKTVQQVGWPFLGPCAVRGVLNAMSGSGVEPQAFNAHWTSVSGVSPTSCTAREHSLLLTTLWMMVCDQLDVLNIAAAEQVARRILMVERAVKQNPKALDFSGLECFLTNAMDGSGALVAQDFDKYASELQKTDAQILKQNRLLQEEVSAKSKKERG
jgi:hypothetical protein